MPSSAAVIDDDAHGAGGPLTTSIREPVNPIAEAFVAACNSAGHATVDYNAGGSALGCSLFQTTVRDGARCSTARAFLDPAAGRSNLTVMTHSHVTRVVIEVNGATKTAVGVEAAVGKGATAETERTVFRANKEVILSAGAIGSPHILSLSGVGDAAALEKAGIKPVHHLIGVSGSDTLSDAGVATDRTPGLAKMVARVGGSIRLVLTWQCRAYPCLHFCIAHLG